MKDVITVDNDIIKCKCHSERWFSLLLQTHVYVQIFHTLLDLPCLTAALEVMDKAKRVEPASVSHGASVEPTSSVEAFHTPRFKPLFNFISRPEAGQGDTINRYCLQSLLWNPHFFMACCNANKWNKDSRCVVVLIVLFLCFCQVHPEQGDIRRIEHIHEYMLLCSVFGYSGGDMPTSGVRYCQNMQSIVAYMMK